MQRSIASKLLPANLSWLYTTGALALFFFALQFVTGCLLLTIYVPEESAAFRSVQVIQHRAELGWLIRQMHSWGASFVIFVLILHVLKVLWFGSYKRPREFTWFVGVVLFGVALAFCFSGYLLPWNQLSFWATRVALEAVDSIRIFGWDVGVHLKTLICGGPDVSGATLGRFFSLHILVLPLLLIVLAGYHLFLITHGGAAPKTTLAEETELGYRGAIRKHGGEPFFPRQVYRDLIACNIGFALLVTFAVFWPWEVGEPASLQTPEGIKPEWYFLPTYQFVKYFDDKFHALLVMGGAGLVFFFLPLLDRGGERRILRRPFFALLALLAFTGVVGLGVVGWLSDRTITIPWSGERVYFDTLGRPSRVPATAGIELQGARLDPVALDGEASRSAPLAAIAVPGSFFAAVRADLPATGPQTEEPNDAAPPAGESEEAGAPTAPEPSTPPLSNAGAEPAPSSEPPQETESPSVPADEAGEASDGGEAEPSTEVDPDAVPPTDEVEEAPDGDAKNPADDVVEKPAKDGSASGDAPSEAEGATAASESGATEEKTAGEDEDDEDEAGTEAAENADNEALSPPVSPAEETEEPASSALESPGVTAGATEDKPAPPPGGTCIGCHDREAEEWHESVHAENGVACVDCHGGNDTPPPPRLSSYLIELGDAECEAAEDIFEDEWALWAWAHLGIKMSKDGCPEAPRAKEIPDFCGKCHERERSLFSPRHLELVEHGSRSCKSCHSNHDVQAIPDDLSFYEKGYTDPADPRSADFTAIRGAIGSVDQALEGARTVLASLEARSYPTEEFKEHLDRLARERDALRPLVHTLDPERVRKGGDGQPGSEKLAGDLSDFEERLETELHREDDRWIFAAGVWGVMLFVSFLLARGLRKLPRGRAGIILGETEPEKDPSPREPASSWKSRSGSPALKSTPAPKATAIVTSFESPPVAEAVAGFEDLADPSARRAARRAEDLAREGDERGALLHPLGSDEDETPPKSADGAET